MPMNEADRKAALALCDGEDVECQCGHPLHVGRCTAAIVDSADGRCECEQFCASESPIASMLRAAIAELDRRATLPDDIALALDHDAISEREATDEMARRLGVALAEAERLTGERDKALADRKVLVEAHFQIMINGDSGWDPASETALAALRAVGEET